MKSIRFFYLMLLVISVLFYIIFMGNISFVVLLMVIIIPLLSLLIGLNIKKNLKIDILIADPLALKNEPFGFIINIKNSSMFSIMESQFDATFRNSFEEIDEALSFDIPVIKKQTERLNFSLKSKYCGIISLNANQFIFYDYFKIFKFKIKFNVVRKVTILPHIYELDLYSGNNNHIDTETDIFSKHKPGDDPSEIFRIREYRPGDKMNHIHWKLSIKQDDILIKENSYPLTSSVLFLYDVSVEKKNPRCLDIMETGLELLASMSSFLCDCEITHTIGWYNLKTSITIKNEIKHRDELVHFIQNYLNCPLGKNNVDLIETYFNINILDIYSHLLLLTSDINQQIINKLSYLDKAKNITILCLTSKSKEEFKKEISAFELEKVQIIGVNIDDFEDSVRELVL